jgi:hypothetical protein
MNAPEVVVAHILDKSRVVEGSRATGPIYDDLPIRLIVKRHFSNQYSELGLRLTRMMITESLEYDPCGNIRSRIGEGFINALAHPDTIGLGRSNCAGHGNCSLASLTRSRSCRSRSPHEGNEMRSDCPGYRSAHPGYELRALAAVTEDVGDGLFAARQRLVPRLGVGPPTFETLSSPAR